MDKANIKTIMIILMLVFTSITSIAWSEEQSNLPNQITTLLSSERAEFQDWLKKNGQDPAPAQVNGQNDQPLQLAQSNTKQIPAPLLNLPSNQQTSAPLVMSPTLKTAEIPPTQKNMPNQVSEQLLQLAQANTEQIPPLPITQPASAGQLTPPNTPSVSAAQIPTPITMSLPVNTAEIPPTQNNMPNFVSGQLLQLAQANTQPIPPPPIAQSTSAQQIPPPHSPSVSAQQIPPPPNVRSVSPEQIPPPPNTQSFSEVDIIPPAPINQSMSNEIPPAPLNQVEPPKAFSAKTQVIKQQPDFGVQSVVETPPMSFTENQEAMIKSAPPALPPSQDSIDAFNYMMQQNVPLSPQQVVKLRQQVDVQQRAAAIPANIPPKPVSSTLMINLAPGTTPPAIRLSQGYITSLVFVDSTGSPWPIASYDVGDPKKIGPPQWDGKSNVLLLQALSPYGDSDLIVRLVGLPTPITLALVFGQRVVDYRTDIHVSGIGPNAKELPIGTGLPGSANQLLLSVLDGIAPSGSKQLNVAGGECQAWLLADKMYLRTRFTVLSPGWIGRMVSPDGMHAYEIQKSSSVLISQYGSPVELKIEGF